MCWYEFHCQFLLQPAIPKIMVESRSTSSGCAEGFVIWVEADKFCVDPEVLYKLTKSGFRLRVGQF